MTPLIDLGKLMFGEWDDDEWCSFDNYMIECLQIYMKKGLVKANFKNQKLKAFMVSTNSDFAYWCGLSGDKQVNGMLAKGRKQYVNYLFLDFLEVCPDAKRFGSRPISNTKFGKYLKSYSKYKFGCLPDVGRDGPGNWIQFRSKHELETNGELDMDF
jgi:hypothetical protein